MSTVLNGSVYLLVAIPGAVLGAVLGVRLVVTVQEPVIFFGVIAVSTILSSILSVKLGLRFWEEIARFRWFGRFE